VGNFKDMADGPNETRHLIINWNDNAFYYRSRWTTYQTCPKLDGYHCQWNIWPSDLNGTPSFEVVAIFLGLAVCGIKLYDICYRWKTRKGKKLSSR